MNPKKIFLFIFVAIFILGFGINVRTIKAQTIDELASQASALQKKIADCQKQIATLNAQIVQFQTELTQVLGKEITTVLNQISQLQKQLPTSTFQPPESGYKCPDLNSDGTVDVLDAIITSNSINKCSGTSGYDSRADVDGNNCVTSTDQNFIQKYLNQKATDITQCKGVSVTPSTTTPSTTPAPTTTPTTTTIAPKPESEYKCPDLNNDGTVDIFDAMITSASFAKCSGDSGYNAKGDVDGNNCVTSTDQNFIQK
jgi:chaperonin cofactor prefoldin